MTRVTSRSSLRRRQRQAAARITRTNAWVITYGSITVTFLSRRIPLVRLRTNLTYPQPYTQTYKGGLYVEAILPHHLFLPIGRHPEFRPSHYRRYRWNRYRRQRRRSPGRQNRSEKRRHRRRA